MTSAFLLAAFLQAAAPAAAPPVSAPATAAPLTAKLAPVAPRVRGTLFIAPSGEGFRGVAGEAYPVAAWFAQADTDHDGRISRSELRADALRYFKILDANADGVVDSREITRYEEELVPEVQVNFGGGGRQYSAPTFSYGSEGDPVQGRMMDDSSADAAPRKIRAQPELPRGAGRYALINAPEPVVAADADLNRRVTPQEMSAAAERRFTLLDPDERGYLTLATLPKTPIQARAEAMIRKPR